MRFVTSLLFIILTASLFSLENDFSNDYVVMGCRDRAGMFSIWMDVISLCDEYDRGNYAGIEVDFEDQGAYFSKEKGKNWWTYYCKPICRGQKKGNIIFCEGDPPGGKPCIESKISRSHAKYLIDKYIFIKDEIVKEIENFYEENLKGYHIISVHFRGTDKTGYRGEAYPVPYSYVSEEIDRYIHDNNISDYRIFLATDEFYFVKYMKLCYRDKLKCLDVIRVDGDEGIHHMNVDRYKAGKEAIIDMVLLSKGNYLIRTSSNLSRWSTWFNPTIPSVCLNQSIYFHND